MNNKKLKIGENHLMIKQSIAFNDGYRASIEIGT
jgi:hypothetical protein